MRENSRARTGIVAVAAVLVLVAARTGAAHEVAAGHAQTKPATEELSRASGEMVRAAANLWDSLSDEQRQSIRFEFAGDERQNFHFVPRKRNGLHWGQMTATQRLLAHALLSSGLSRRTYVETTTIMSLEEILAGIEQGRGPKRDPDLYYFTLFGMPSAQQAWGWRVEGHHVSLNFTIVNGRGIAGAPAFLGTNPAEVREGPRKGLRILAAEEEMGFRLVRSLDDEQKKIAILSEKAPSDIITGAKRKVEIDDPAGVTFGSLNPEQQAMLRALVHVYAHRLRDELAHHELAGIEAADWAKVHFAWAGETEPGVGHYYRIHGPTFVIELDNTQNNANHVHTVWRGLQNDFGEDLLRAHYKKEHR